MTKHHPKPSWRIRIIAYVFITLFCFIILEGFSIGYLTWRDGKFISASERFQNFSNNTFVVQLRSKDSVCRYIDTLYPHPYLAFVHHNNPPCGMEYINNIGLFGYDFPVTKDNNYFTILLTGGSVAAQFAGVRSESIRFLEKELNTHYKSTNGKKFRVLNGADGAWKQPQQSILLLMYADAIDAVISLDGFNEHYSIGADKRLEYPANNFALTNPLVNESYTQVFIRIFVGQFIQALSQKTVIKYSHAAFLFTKGVDRLLKKIPVSLQAKKTTLESVFALPADWNEKQRQDWTIQKYQNYIRSMNALANQYNLKSAYFIQPVPAIDKILTVEEKLVVGDLSYAEKYQQMTNQLLKLRQENIAVFSLLSIFKNFNDAVYSDHIHLLFNPDSTSSANEKMANIIAEKIAAEWKLQPKKIP
jgi:hypothetical protein